MRQIIRAYSGGNNDFYIDTKNPKTPNGKTETRRVGVEEGKKIQANLHTKDIYIRGGYTHTSDK